jgi:homoserine O-acetyltransferase
MKIPLLVVCVVALLVSSPAAQDAADEYVDGYMAVRLKAIQTGAVDANDLWYAFNASRDYDPSPSLEKVEVPVIFINSADDFINPPELGIAQREIQRVSFRYLLGSGSHGAPAKR